MEAIDEGHRRDDACLLRCLDQTGCGLRVGRERLLADDVLAGGDGRERLLRVERVGCAHVHDVDGRVLEQFVERGVAALEAETRCDFGRALRGGGDDAEQPSSGCSGRAAVDGGHEATAHHCDAG